ncbi:MAG: TVP38/TMEM64 family protein [Myxococcales bacterium]|nr:TVP38/TMEM64 family protein [Myxococcales bacterium]
MRHGGPAALAMYLGLYIVGSLLTAPMALLSGLAGFAWGFSWGLAAALPIATIGATSAFLGGRLLSRLGWVRARLGHPKMRLIDAVVRADGFRIAALLRLSPVMPQNLLSYALGTTPLKLWQFSASTFLGMVPATVLHVYVGSVVRDASELMSGRGGPGGAARWALPVLGLVATVAFLAMVMRLAKRQIAESMARVEPQGP